MSEITIYHNPRCSKSRQTLELLEKSNPVVIEYLKQPLNEFEIRQLLKKLNINARDMMRQKDKLYAELKLDSQQLTEQQLIEAMVEHPILIERPIVVRADKAVIARPPELALELV